MVVQRVVKMFEGANRSFSVECVAIGVNNLESLEVAIQDELRFEYS